MSEHLPNLKALAEACIAAGEYLPGDAWTEDRSYGPAEVAWLEFAAQATPAAILALIAETAALRKDAERYRFVRNPIGTTSPLAIWNEGKMPLFSGMADAVVDEFMAKEAQP